MRNMPTDKEVLELLYRHKQLSIHELIYHLAVAKSEEQTFKKNLKNMVHDKLIKISHDDIVSTLHNLHLCDFNANKDGHGGIAVDVDSKQQIHISHDHDLCAIDGDRVAVAIDGVDKHGISIGHVVNIIKHKLEKIVGRIELYKNKYYLISDNEKISLYPVIVITDDEIKISPSTIYSSVVENYPTSGQTYFQVKILRELGEVGDDAVFVEKVLVESNAQTIFSAATMEYVDALEEHIDAKDLHGRQDLRNLPFVTIDGEDARDFDDAVYCEINPDKSFTLSVAIADVSHYVKHESALDLDAFERSTSIYFPRRVVPMLPEKLSNGLCSLNPDVDRLVMVCHMEVSADGEITSYGVDNAVIHSHHRLTYTRMQRFLESHEEIPEDIKANIDGLHKVYRALLKARHKRGAIDFEGSEPYFKFDENGNVSGLAPRERQDAHKLIEECMLAANVSVANFLAEHNHPTLYRNHDRPNEKKFSALKSYLNSIAVEFNVTQESVTPKDYQQLVERIKDFPNTVIIQQTILRSMQLAEYAPKNIGHFGLAYEKYLHFTSPIRRYPDLLVHRACKAIIARRTYGYLSSIDAMAEQTSFCERRAENLERKVDSYYKCKFASQHIGSQYSGIITTVVSFGVFVVIPELMIDGLVHITELGGEYFVFDEKNHSLVGKNSGHKYIAGQGVEVMIAGVNMDKLFIDLELVGVE